MPVTSADRCTYTGALPGPTLRHGLPAALVRATIFGPPVVQRKSTSGWRKRWYVTSWAASGITCSAPCGRPAASPAAARISTTRCAERTAYGDGRNNTALRVFAATIALKSTVDVGLV